VFVGVVKVAFETVQLANQCGEVVVHGVVSYSGASLMGFVS
jgi:hypothetical protein